MILCDGEEGDEGGDGDDAPAVGDAAYNMGERKPSKNIVHKVDPFSPIVKVNGNAQTNSC